MNTTVTADEVNISPEEKPGMQLARIREKKGYSQDYVAGKLHLRTRIIELLEVDDYQKLPEAVFIKGYLRAYAKLLGVAPEPLLDIFNGLYITQRAIPQRKLEKTLWQSKRESHRGEYLVRWLTGLMVVIVVIGVSMWWQKNKDPLQLTVAKTTEASLSLNKAESDLRLTDLSKMQNLFNSNSQLPPLEIHGG